MARFIQAEFPTEHAGVTRFTRGFAAIGQLDTALSIPVLAALAFIGAPLRRAAVPLTTRLAAWSEARKQRAEDDKLWAVALTDARVMADLSRAMSAEADRSARQYY
ncbi:MAG TPA: hypothetical protein VIL30_17790 [Ramlibacter sp.]|jgi:hypothetical protein